MFYDRDTWKAAVQLIERYGDEALPFGDQRAKLSARAQDVKGAMAWRRVVAAARLMLAEEPAGTIH